MTTIPDALLQFRDVRFDGESSHVHDIFTQLKKPTSDPSSNARHASPSTALARLRSSALARSIATDASPSLAASNDRSNAAPYASRSESYPAPAGNAASAAGPLCNLAHDAGGGSIVAPSPSSASSASSRSRCDAYRRRRSANRPRPTRGGVPGAPDSSNPPLDPSRKPSPSPWKSWKSLSPPLPRQPSPPVSLAAPSARLRSRCSASAARASSSDAASVSAARLAPSSAASRLAALAAYAARALRRCQTPTRVRAHRFDVPRYRARFLAHSRGHIHRVKPRHRRRRDHRGLVFICRSTIRGIVSPRGDGLGARDERGETFGRQSLWWVSAFGPRWRRGGRRASGLGSRRRGNDPRNRRVDVDDEFVGDGSLRRGRGPSPSENAAAMDAFRRGVLAEDGKRARVRGIGRASLGGSSRRRRRRRRPANGTDFDGLRTSTDGTPPRGVPVPRAGTGTGMDLRPRRTPPQTRRRRIRRFGRRGRGRGVLRDESPGRDGRGRGGGHGLASSRHRDEGDGAALAVAARGRGRGRGEGDTARGSSEASSRRSSSYTSSAISEPSGDDDIVSARGAITRHDAERAVAATVARGVVGRDAARETRDARGTRETAGQPRARRGVRRPRGRRVSERVSERRCVNGRTGERTLFFFIVLPPAPTYALWTRKSRVYSSVRLAVSPSLSPWDRHATTSSYKSRPSGAPRYAIRNDARLAYTTSNPARSPAPRGLNSSGVPSPRPTGTSSLVRLPAPDVRTSSPSAASPRASSPPSPAPRAASYDRVR